MNRNYMHVSRPARLRSGENSFPAGPTTERKISRYLGKYKKQPGPGKLRKGDRCTAINQQTHLYCLFILLAYTI